MPSYLLRDGGIERVASRIAGDYDFTIDDVRKHDRRGNIVKVRFAIYWFLHRQCGATLVQIGDALNRNHTSVMNGVHTLESLEMLELLVPQAKWNYWRNGDAVIGVVRNVKKAISSDDTLTAAQIESAAMRGVDYSQHEASIRGKW